MTPTWVAIKEDIESEATGPSASAFPLHHHPAKEKDFYLLARGTYPERGGRSKRFFESPQKVKWPCTMSKPRIERPGLSKVKFALQNEHRQEHAPPKWADCLLAWYCGNAPIDDLHGDIEELFTLIQTMSPGKALL